MLERIRTLYGVPTWNEQVAENDRKISGEARRSAFDLPIRASAWL